MTAWKWMHRKQILVHARLLQIEETFVSEPVGSPTQKA